MSKLPLAAVVALALCSLSGYAIAQSTSPSPTPKKIKACAKKKGGSLRLSRKRCRRGERRVTWAVAGPRGPQGLAGAPGQPGQPGAPGTNGANGTNGTNGADGTSTGETFAESDFFGANFGTGPCDGTPAGPSITVDAPGGSYAQVMASVTMQRAGATSNSACIRVDGDDIPFASSTSLSAETRYLQSGSSTGVTSKYAARPLTFPLDAGSHTISMRYGSVGGTSSFNNRNLYVTVFHPTP
jgi:hypothetical protein